MLSGNASRRVVVDRADRGNLIEALDYVVKGWMPISPEVIKTIRSKLSSGVYEHERGQLIFDLKGDFSLFTWFLSKLDNLYVPQRKGKAISLDEYVRRIEIDKLIQVFNEPDESKHCNKRESALRPQYIALKQAVTAVTATESAAEAKNLDPILANMCAGVRQLGVNLIAWNYPRIYNKALENSSNANGSLDRSLRKLLGYSPLELGTELAFKWDQSGSLAAFISNDSEKIRKLSADGLLLLGDSREELLKCIDFGEKVSRLVTPDELPQETIASMPSLISEIESFFGKSGIEVLRQKLKSAMFIYHGVENQQGEVEFDFDLDSQKISEIARRQLAAEFVQKNIWASKCPKEFQKKFTELYGFVDKKNISPTAINILVTEVIPMLGFTKGCVYVVEKARMRLNPVMRIGSAPISRYRALEISDSGTSTHPVIAALGYSAPLIQENVAVNGEFVSHVSGIFESDSNSAGVLYLEMSQKLASSADRGPALLFFKAIRQALLDCLNL